MAVWHNNGVSSAWQRRHQWQQATSKAGIIIIGCAYGWRRSGMAAKTASNNGDSALNKAAYTSACRHRIATKLHASMAYLSNMTKACSE